MTASFPSWPPDWLEDRTLAAEGVVAEEQGVVLTHGLGSDGQVLLSVSWPEGRRWMLIDPVGGGLPQALRIGQDADDPGIARLVDRTWSQALGIAKQLIDGDVGE